MVLFMFGVSVGFWLGIAAFWWFIWKVGKNGW